jgi:hypothetical protein
MVELSVLLAWTRVQLAMRRSRAAAEAERGDGILIWVVMTALLAAAAIAIVAIIVTKATSTANNVQTQ